MTFTLHLVTPPTLSMDFSRTSPYLAAELEVEKTRGRALSTLHDRYKTDSLCWRALFLWPEAIGSVPSHLLDEEKADFVTEALTESDVSARILVWLPPIYQTLARWRRAVSLRKEAVLHVPYSLFSQDVNVFVPALLHIVLNKEEEYPEGSVDVDLKLNLSLIWLRQRLP